MSDIEFRCDQCGKNLSIDEQGAGMQVTCPECAAQIIVPSAPARLSVPPHITRNSPPPPPIPGVMKRNMRPQPQHTVSTAIVSLVLGILGIIAIGPLGSIPAVICGHLARSKISGNPDTFKGNGMALTGLILGYLQIGILILLLPLAAILVPAVNKALTSAAMVQTVSNGANIYKAAAHDYTADWPKKGQYRTSTEYFKHLVESGDLPVSYAFFSARGIPDANSTDPQDFTAENNAWRVVLGLDNAPEGTPFMFTRNYNPSELNSGDDPIVLSDEPPFGKEGLIVVLKGGSAYSLKKNQLNNEYFNPAGYISDHNIEIIGP